MKSTVNLPKFTNFPVRLIFDKIVLLHIRSFRQTRVLCEYEEEGEKLLVTSYKCNYLSIHFYEEIEIRLLW